MLPQRTVQKLGRHFHGLDNYMVASYPQHSGEREFREIVRDLEKMEDRESGKKEEKKRMESLLNPQKT